MDKTQFEELVREALKSLPKAFRDKLENVEIIVEETPIDTKSLLGLYQGVPLKHRGHWYGNVLPDKITLFKENIERISRDDEQTKKLINDVLIHEIAHHFGFSEDELTHIADDH